MESEPASYRYVTWAPLPEHRDQLAALMGASGIAVAHQPLGRRQNRHPQSVLDPRNLSHLHVTPETGGRHPSELPDDRGVSVILQVHAEQTMAAIIQHLVVLDVMVVRQQPGDLRF